MCRLHEIEKILRDPFHFVHSGCLPLEGLFRQFPRKRKIFQNLLYFCHSGCLPSEGYLSSLREKYLKAWNILGPLDAYHMRGIHGRKYFCKTPSQTPVFTAISEGVLSLSMQLDKFIIIHLLHSSPPEPEGRAP